MADNYVAIVLSAVVVLFAAFAGASVLDSFGVQNTVIDQAVDTTSEWEAGTLTADAEVVNGTLQLTDGTTTEQTYTSQNFSYSNTTLSYLKVYSEVPENTTVDATVTVYDGTDTAIDSVTQSISEDESVDVSSLADLSSGEYYQVEVALDSSDGTVTPTVDEYTVSNTEQRQGLVTLAVLVLVLGAVALVASRALN